MAYNVLAMSSCILRCCSARTAYRGVAKGRMPIARHTMLSEGVFIR